MENSTRETQTIVRTSEQDWLAQLAVVYKNKTPAKVIDDAEFGINPAKDSFFEMARKAEGTRFQWRMTLAALGVTGASAWILIAAILDPEPVTKILLILGGIGCLMHTGGKVIYEVLFQQKPIVRDCQDGFEISWV